MLVIAILNGTLRELVIRKQFTYLASHQLSTVSLLLFFAIYIWFVNVRFPPASAWEALLVGGFWLLLTLAFEFGFGRWRGASWETLLADYNLLKGRFWVLIPIWVAIAPYLFYRFSK
jgi:hypothetical protein